MAVKHYIITALWFFIAKLTFGEVTSIKYGHTNGNITLQANIRGVLEEILWKWNGNKVLDSDKISTDEYLQFKGRTSVNFTTGDLTLSSLTVSDSGIYNAEAQVEGKLQYAQHHVEIMDPVADPIVTCEVSGSSLTLLCASDLDPLTSYSWEGPSGPALSGSELHLESTENRDWIYTCVVKNPASERRATIAVQDCFTARSVAINLAIAVGVLSVLLGVLVGLWFYYKKRCKASQQARHKDTEAPENETGEKVPFLGKMKAGQQDHKENNLDKESLQDQEDTSNSVPPVASPPEQGGVSIERVGVEQGGVSIERVGVDTEHGAVAPEQGGVSIGLNNEGGAEQEEPGNSEDPPQESTSKPGAQEGEKVEEGVAKCQDGNLPKPLSENQSNPSTTEAEPLPGRQVEAGEARGGAGSAQGESEGQEEQSGATSDGLDSASHTGADKMEGELKRDSNANDAQNQ